MSSINISTSVINVTLSSYGSVQATTKEFSTGSKGWYANGKVSIPVGASMPAIPVTICGQALIAYPKDGPSASGNFGWYANGKVVIDGHKVQVGINITACKCNGIRPVNTTVSAQVGGNLIIVGSKPKVEDGTQAPKPAQQANEQAKVEPESKPTTKAPKAKKGRRAFPS